MQENSVEEKCIGQAREVRDRVKSVVRGEVAVTDKKLHAWALQVLTQRNPSSPMDEAIEACLVDILSCDDAPWDTPLEAFQADLARLEAAIKAAESRKAVIRESGGVQDV